MDDVSLSGFVLGFAVAGESVLYIISVAVAWIRVVVGVDGFNYGLGDYFGDWSVSVSNWGGMSGVCYWGSVMCVCCVCWGSVRGVSYGGCYFSYWCSVGILCVRRVCRGGILGYYSSLSDCYEGSENDKLEEEKEKLFFPRTFFDLPKFF